MQRFGGGSASTLEMVQHTHVKIRERGTGRGGMTSRPVLEQFPGRKCVAKHNKSSSTSVNEFPKQHGSS